MSDWMKFLEEKMEVVDESTKKWIQSAIHKDHEGYCTPMTKKTCTPRRKALVMRFKKGGDLYKTHKKKKD